MVREGETTAKIFGGICAGICGLLVGIVVIWFLGFVVRMLISYAAPIFSMGQQQTLAVEPAAAVPPAS